MRIANIERVEGPARPQALPLDIVHTSGRLGSATLLLTSVLSIAAVLMPAGMIAAHAAVEPNGMALIVDRPLTSILAATGLGLILGLLMIPLRAAIAGMKRNARVRIGDGPVDGEERGLLATTRWSVPLASFSGVAHHVRATLSGARHEVVLIHADRSRDILLALGHRQLEAGAHDYARLLGLPVLHPRELYRRRSATPAVEMIGLSPASVGVWPIAVSSASSTS